jgi:hypothetical protein
MRVSNFKPKSRPRYDRSGRQVRVPCDPEAEVNRNRFAPLAVEISGIYFPLSGTLRETRLLLLTPAPEWSTPLTCDLRTVSLIDKPAYKALSYVGGTDEEAGIYQIQLCDEEVDVSRHLFNALKRIRGEDQTLLIWVDAVDRYQLVRH